MSRALQQWRYNMPNDSQSRYHSLFNGQTGIVKNNGVLNVEALAMLNATSKDSFLATQDLAVFIKHELTAVAYEWESLQEAQAYYQEAYAIPELKQWLDRTDHLTANALVQLAKDGLLAALDYDVMFAKMLQVLQHHQQLDVIYNVDIEGNTLLHHPTGNINSLNHILAHTPVAQHSAVLANKNNQGIPAIHKLAEVPEVIPSLVEMFPIAQRLPLLRITDNDEKSLLHCIVHDATALHQVLTLLPEEQRLEAVLISDSWNRNTVFECAAQNNPDSILAIASIVDNGLLLDALKQKDSDGNTMLHLIAEYFEKSLAYVFALYPAAERLAALQVTNNENSSVISQIIETVITDENADFLKVIIELLPQEQRQAVLNLDYVKGMSCWEALSSEIEEPVSAEIIVAIQSVLPSNNQTATSLRSTSPEIMATRHRLFSTLDEPSDSPPAKRQRQEEVVKDISGKINFDYNMF
jgi:hypothetical protein